MILFVSSFGFQLSADEFSIDYKSMAPYIDKEIESAINFHDYVKISQDLIKVSLGTEDSDQYVFDKAEEIVKSGLFDKWFDLSSRCFPCKSILCDNYPLGFHCNSFDDMELFLGEIKAISERRGWKMPPSCQSAITHITLNKSFTYTDNVRNLNEAIASKNIPGVYNALLKIQDHVKSCELSPFKDSFGFLDQTNSIYWGNFFQIAIDFLRESESFIYTELDRYSHQKFINEGEPYINNLNNLIGFLNKYFYSKNLNPPELFERIKSRASKVWAQIKDKPMYSMGWAK